MFHRFLHIKKTMKPYFLKKKTTALLGGRLYKIR